MSKKSRTKGAVGEREWAKEINHKFGTDYRRTPLSGGLDIRGDIRKTYNAPPTIIDRFSWEVKRQEKLNIYSALDQATRDARHKIPIVAHRRNNDKWKVTLWGDDFLNLMKELEEKSNND